MWLEKQTKPKVSLNESVIDTVIKTGNLRTILVEYYDDDTPIIFYNTFLSFLLILLVHISKFNVHDTFITLLTALHCVRTRRSDDEAKAGRGPSRTSVFYFYIFQNRFLQKYIFGFIIYRFIPLPPDCGWPGGRDLNINKIYF